MTDYTLTKKLRISGRYEQLTSPNGIAFYACKVNERKATITPTTHTMSCKDYMTDIILADALDCKVRAYGLTAKPRMALSKLHGEDTYTVLVEIPTSSLSNFRHNMRLLANAERKAGREASRLTLLEESRSSSFSTMLLEISDGWMHKPMGASFYFTFVRSCGYNTKLKDTFTEHLMEAQKVVPYDNADYRAISTYMEYNAPTRRKLLQYCWNKTYSRIPWNRDLYEYRRGLGDTGAIDNEVALFHKKPSIFTYNSWTGKEMKAENRAAGPTTIHDSGFMAVLDSAHNKRNPDNFPAISEAMVRVMEILYPAKEEKNAA